MALISILLPDLRAGGVERIRLELAREFKRKGHSVEFVLRLKQGELLDSVLSEFPVYCLEAKRVRNMPWPLIRYIRDRKPDALLVAMWPLSGLAAICTKVSGVDTHVVVSEHNDLRMTPAMKGKAALFLRFLGKYLYGLCHNVIAVSNGVRQSVSELTRLSSEKILVINNPLRSLVESEISAADKETFNIWQGSRLRIISIGSLKPQKGFDILLKAFQTVAARCDASLMIIGEGPERSGLESLVREYNLEGSVFLLGYRPNPECYLVHADLFVLASRWEGFGNVIIESLALGVPIVSSDCPSGPAEILEDGKFGILVKVESPVALAGAIMQSRNLPKHKDRLRARAKDFSLSAVSEQYLLAMFGK